MSATAAFEYLYNKVQEAKNTIAKLIVDSQPTVFNSDLAVEGNFKIFSQNVAGLATNRDLFFHLISSKLYDIIALQETHLPTLPLSYLAIIQKYGYHALYINAFKDSEVIKGRYCGGSLVLVRKCYHLQNINVVRQDWGELISFVLGNAIKFHCVYRYPSTLLKEIVPLFSESLNSNLRMYYIGDFNLQLSQPKSAIKLKCCAANIKDCYVAPANEAPTMAKFRKQATNLLQPFPLHVLSRFQPTHVRGRQLDYIMCNSVAKNHMSQFNRLCGAACQFNMCSDHKALELGCDIHLNTAVQPASFGGSSLQISQSLLNNGIVQYQALSMILAATQHLDWQQYAPTLRLVHWSVICFQAFKIAGYLYACHFPPKLHTYSRVFRKFRNIIARGDSYKEQRIWLRQQRWKYNVLNSCATQRSVKLGGNDTRNIYRLLRNNNVSQPVECTSSVIHTHFEQFLNQPVQYPFMSKSSEVQSDFLQDFVALPDNVVTSLTTNISTDEITLALKDMKSNASPGLWGLSVNAIALLCKNPILLEFVCSSLNLWLQGDSRAEMFLTVLSAIPKPKRTTNIPANLRPISVTSSWYKLIARILAQRLQPHILLVYSTNQHGFAPHRSCITALYHILQTQEFCEINKSPMFMLAMDIHKAYDQVDRSALLAVCTKVGLHQSPLFQHIMRGSTIGQTMVKGPMGLFGGFTTSRGIKQGCPLSPLLFAIILSGLERRLQRLHPNTGIALPSGHVRVFSYADDVKLVAKDSDELNILFSEVLNYLSYLGLSCDPSKCAVLPIRQPNVHSVYLHGCALDTSDNIRFLGMFIDRKGQFSSGDRSVLNTLNTLYARLSDIGLNMTPLMWSKVYQIFAVQKASYGCEIWAAQLVAKCLLYQHSPFNIPIHDDFLTFVRNKLALPQNSFAFPLLRLFNIKSGFALVYKQLLSLIPTLPTTFWNNAKVIASKNSQSVMAALLNIKEFSEAQQNCSVAQQILSVEQGYFQTQSQGSRTLQIAKLFGNVPCVFACFQYKVSLLALRSLARLLTLQHSYFWNKVQHCHLCGLQVKPTIAHIIGECTATTDLCTRFQVPHLPEFARFWLLNRTAAELGSFATDLFKILDGKGRGKRSRIVGPVVQIPRVLTLQPHYFLKSDGSFSSHGAGIGLTLCNDVGTSASFAVPVKAFDAQRTELLGPVLGSLLLSKLPPGQVTILGDSQFVIGLLNRQYVPKDVFMVNCVDLISDMLHAFAPSFDWISRTLNVKCDTLARQAVASTTVFVDGGAFPPDVIESWHFLCSKFSEQFGQRF